jgi:D-alanyl-D-alanine carboxypeptidase
MKTPWPKESDAAVFYGAIELGADGLPTERWERSRLTTFTTPFELRLSWQPETRVRRIRCAQAVAADLVAIFEEIFELFDNDAEQVAAARMDLYGGCYNFRRKRGLAGLSMHAYGAAVDLDPENNPLGKAWRAKAGMIPIEVVKIFEGHGWLWGGRWTRRPDCMHFQAAS